MCLIYDDQEGRKFSYKIFSLWSSLFFSQYFSLHFLVDPYCNSIVRFNLHLFLRSFYFLFVGHFTRFTLIYLLVHKSKVQAKFVQFKVMAETQFSSKIKALRSDRGGEYTSKAFESFLSSDGNIH